MSNMSYCQFENTGRAIDQLIGTLEDARSKSDLNLNEYEQRAYDDLAGKCEQVVSLMEDMENKPTYDEDEVKDGVDSCSITADQLDSFDNSSLRVARDEADRLYAIAVTPGSWNETKAGYYKNLEALASQELEQRREER